MRKMKVDVQHILKEIAQSDDYRFAGTAAAYRQIAAELSNLAIPKKQWSWNYLHQVAHGKLQPSRPLADAILRFHKKLKIRDCQITGYEPTEVFAPAGFLAPGTIINAISRKCSSSLCDRDFVPLHPNQRFCSPQCRRKFHQMQRRGDLC